MSTTYNNFTVDAVVEGRLQQVSINQSETTDGVSFYIRRIGDDEVSQVRKDSQEWKQIWGDLNESDHWKCH